MAFNSNVIIGLNKFLEKVFNDLKLKAHSASKDLLWFEQGSSVKDLSSEKQDAVVRESFALLAENMDQKKKSIIELKGLLQKWCKDLDDKFLESGFYGQDTKIKNQIVNIIMWWIMVVAFEDETNVKRMIITYFDQLSKTLLLVKDENKIILRTRKLIGDKISQINAIRDAELVRKNEIKSNYKRQKLSATVQDEMGDQYSENFSTRMKSVHTNSLADLYEQTKMQVDQLEIEIDGLVTKLNEHEQSIYENMSLAAKCISFSFFKHETWAPWLMTKIL
jgi:hypothetical protein